MAPLSSTTAPLIEETKPLRADARRNRERILEAGRDAFIDRGQDVQMDEIAQRAGVGVGTLYRHFPTKEALVMELVHQSVQTCIVSTVQALDHEDPWAAVEWLIRDHARNMSSNRGLRDALAGIKFQDDNPWDDPELRAQAASVIERAQRAGAMRADITVDDWQALMCGLSAAIAYGGDAERLVEFALAGLRAH
jgi:AcrR family transcriptional regulator